MIVRDDLEVLAPNRPLLEQVMASVILRTRRFGGRRRMTRIRASEGIATVHAVWGLERPHFERRVGAVDRPKILPGAVPDRASKTGIHKASHGVDREV